MSIYKDAKMTFFEFCFSECNTSHFQLQEISLIVKKWEPIVSVLFLLMIAGKFIIGLLLDGYMTYNCDRQTSSGGH